jgi:hypothetical protein
LIGVAMGAVLPLATFPIVAQVGFASPYGWVGQTVWAAAAFKGVPLLAFDLTRRIGVGILLAFSALLVVAAGHVHGRGRRSQRLTGAPTPGNTVENRRIATPGHSAQHREYFSEATFLPGVDSRVEYRCMPQLWGPCRRSAGDAEVSRRPSSRSGE